MSNEKNVILRRGFTRWLLVSLCIAMLGGCVTDPTTSEEAVTFVRAALPDQTRAFVAQNLMATNATIEVGPQSPATIGQGYKTLTGNLAGKGVNLGAVVKGRIDKDEFSLEMIESSTTLKERMNIGAQASFSGLWGGVDSSMQFLNSSEISTYRTFLLVRVKVYTEFEQLADFRLRNAANNLLKSDLTAFYHQYGDEFIASLTYGGELYGLIEFASSSQAEKSDLQVSLAASLGTFNASADFNRAFEATNRHSSRSVRILRRGANGGLLQVTPAQLQQAAVDFPATVRSSPPVPVLATTYSYATAERADSYPAPEVSKTRLALRNLAEERDRVELLARGEKYIAENRSQFQIEEPDVQVLRDLKNWAKSALEKVDRLAVDISVKPFDDPAAQVDATRTQLGVDVWERKMEEIRLKWGIKPAVATAKATQQISFIGGWQHTHGNKDISSGNGLWTELTCLRRAELVDGAIVVTADFRVKEKFGDGTEFSGTRTSKFEHPGGGRIVRIVTPDTRHKIVHTYTRKVRSEVWTTRAAWLPGDSTFVLDGDGDDQDRVGVTFQVDIEYEYTR